ncbi:type II secretion system protein GspL [Aliidiomarina iranensis]|uniref:Type II secretion system protein L n=1 Tax=Aliidiomarina iranensis TaxID=1434071 RepID=A0A432W339_9GAMM|nr:type II secretion system protein GspL [Aliidiomarina iranensis]RUO23635.1 type II secretion system protein GspL [Aliidiomarina iranensis]
MNEQLIIRLPAGEQGPVSWLVWHSEEASVVASGELKDIAELGELTERAQNRELRVYVSSAAIGFHQVDLPAKSRRHLDRVIPYALEDEIAEDIEQLHFFWPDMLPKESAIPVFVVRRDQVERWLNQLSGAGLHTTVMYPDIFLLPLQQNVWSMAVFPGAFGKEWVIRQDAWRGIVLEPELAMGMQPEENEVLTEISAFGDIEWPQPPAPLIAKDPALPLQLAVHSQPQSVNILQGDYQLHSGGKKDYSFLKFPSIAAAVFLALLFVNEWMGAVALEREAELVRSQYEELYRQTFPEDSRIVDIRSQLAQKVGTGGAGNPGQVLQILQQLQPAFNDVPMQLTMLQYDHSRGELRMQANGENFQSFERFSRIAREQNLDVNQGQLNSRGGQINGTIIVRVGV